MSSTPSASRRPAFRHPRLAWRHRASPLGALAAGTALILAAPPAAVAIRAVSARSDSWQHLVATLLPQWSLNTLLLLAMVGFGVLALGVPTAWLTARHDFPARRALEVLLVLPLAFPPYIAAMTFGWFLDSAGPLQSGIRAATGARGAVLPSVHSLWGAGLVLSLGLYPYVYLLARRAFRAGGGSVFEAARTLGAGRWRLFFRVGLPLARPALAAGVAIALMETLADYGAVSLLGVQTWTTAIFRAWLGFGDLGAAARLSALLLGAVALVLGLERVSRGGRSFAVSGGGVRLATRVRLRGASAWGAFAVCLVGPILGAALPTGVLLRLSASTPLGAGVLGALASSLVLALAAAVLALVFFLPLAYATRSGAGAITRMSRRVVSLGYAAPGAVVAVGVVSVLAVLGEGLGLGRAWLSVSLVGLFYAYLVRFGALALETLDAGLARVSHGLDDAARGLGRTRAQTLFGVHVPLLWSSVLLAGLFVFVEVLKELPATLLIRPFGFETLAVLIWSRASDERLAEAAVPALCLVAVGLVSVFLVYRASEAGQREVR